MNIETIEPEEYFLIGQDDEGLAVYLRYSLFKALEDFAKRETQSEQVGLLVGRESKTQEGLPFILVEDAIEAPIGDENTGRFEESLWRRARRIASARHPEHLVVGWFHTRLQGEVELTEEERGVHKRYFPEENQVLYVIAARGKDRNFFYRSQGELKPAQGFRIYGKTPTSTESQMPVGAVSGVNAVAANPEQQARHLERNIEKLTKRLDSPPVTLKDMAIIGLLILNALLILFRPSPPVAVDTSALERGQSDLSAQLGSVGQRIEKLERRLGDLRVLDDQLKLAAGLENIGDPALDAPLPQESEEKPAANSGGEALTGGGGAIKLYKVVSGDILSNLVDKFYPDAPEATVKRFAEFNRLQAPDFAIFPGDTLKVPSLEVLRSR